MTETEWLACGDPERMLLAVTDVASERQLRLFACLLSPGVADAPDEALRQAIRAAEQHIDGLVTAEELQGWADAAFDSTPEGVRWSGIREAVLAACYSGGDLSHLKQLAVDVSINAYRALPYYWSVEARQAVYADLLRDIFGPTPRCPVTYSPRSLTWDGGTVVWLARGIYEERAFDRLPVLSDALEEAGCSDEVILTHLRAPGRHVRGCWVVDWILRKS